MATPPLDLDADAEESPAMFAARRTVAHVLFRALVMTGPIQLTQDERDYFTTMLDEPLADLLTAGEVERRLAGAGHSPLRRTSAMRTYTPVDERRVAIESR